MSTWDEYAALVRRLDDVVRGDELARSRDVQHREAVAAGVAQLDQRLAAQQQRLAHLGQAIGRPSALASSALVPSGLVPSGLAPSAAAPLADAAVSLAAARQHADAADSAAFQAESLAQQAPLLPTLSPLARALAVYGGCAAVAGLLQLVLVVLAEPDVIDAFSLYAWMCAGVPAIAFFAGYVVLSVWGKPRLMIGAPARYAPIGFAICFASAPVVYCGLTLARSVLLP